MKIGTITFHGAHNYGSMLQAFALQNAILELGHECEIINLRTPAQKQMYRIITGRMGIGPVLKDLSHLIFYRNLSKKHKRFERFLAEHLCTTKEYTLCQELKDAAFDYDYVICGSDQIWKPGISDFDEAYLLPFVSCKKLAYAPSYGPYRPFPSKYIELFKKNLKDFKAISVREEGTRRILSESIGIDNIEVVCDPVFLLERDKWSALIPKLPVVKGKYIFFYSLFADAEMIRMAKVLSQRTGLPVVSSNFSTIHDLTSGFRKVLDVGPIEFLNLIKNAEIVCTSSFHGTALALILNKQIISLNGKSDNRINQILSAMGVEQVSYDTAADLQHCCGIPTINYNEVNPRILQYRESGLNFLKSNIQ